MIARMAWRNLWRNRRRTVLTIAAISLGLAVLMTMVSFMEGMMQMMVEQIARSSLGHIQIHHPDYLEKRASNLLLEQASGMIRVVSKVDGVKAAAERMLFSAAIRSNLSSTVRVVRMVGVDPARERDFSGLVDKVEQGGFVVPPPESLDPSAPARVRERKGILIGRKLAEQLKVELGSKVRVDCAGFNGATAAAAFYVTGILHTGTDAFDMNTVLVALDNLQEVTGAGDVVHEVTLMAHDPKTLDQLAERVRQALLAAGFQDDGFVVQPWYEVMPEIRQMLDLSQAWSGILYLMMLIVMSAGILSTMYMVVFERRREFGVQLALGTRPMRLFITVMTEACYMALLSALVGLAVGALSVAYISTQGIDLSGIMKGFEFSGAFVDNVYRGAMTPKVFVEPTLVVVFGTLAFAFWPSLRVARMRAIDAIKQGGTTN